MHTKYSGFRYLIIIIPIVLALGFLNLAMAAPPEIDSITPDIGSNKVPTQITIHGSGFQPAPKAALYSGGPYITGSYDTPDSASGVYITDTYAYVADGDSGLQVINISEPASPSIVGACDTPGSASGVYVAGTYAYVADYGSGLQIIDISESENPRMIGLCETRDRAFDVCVQGAYAYLTWSSGH